MKKSETNAMAILCWVCCGLSVVACLGMIVQYILTPQIDWTSIPAMAIGAVICAVLAVWEKRRKHGPA